MRRAVRNPEDYCPICGAKVGRSGHRCDEATLRRIDAAHRGADVEPGQRLRAPGYAERLRDAARSRRLR